MALIIIFIIIFILYISQDSPQRPEILVWAMGQTALFLTFLNYLICMGHLFPVMP